MAQITIDVPDELSDRLTEMGDRLPELLALSLQQPPLPARVYRYVLDFLASNPTPEEIVNFRPTSEMQERLSALLLRSQNEQLTESERQELDEYERIEHLIIMLKTDSLIYRQRSNVVS